MSKINALRLINLNYNNNSIKISDEIFHFNGECTLLSLRNGGGKSVLVQMMMAPFVHPRYRDAKDRPFESYFTGSKPTFILVEWALDRGAGFVLTGMMVRRSPNMDEEQRYALDMINFVSEYQQPCIGDIRQLPVVERQKNALILKNYMDCRRLFEDLKRDRSLSFFYYDMNNSAQSRQYFSKLMEYQINYKEWETIIKKINLEESGLAKLFTDCRDERGLVEKWFLPAVEGKMSRDKDRMQEFQTIIEKYVGQYKDNQSKIRQRDTIALFQEEGQRIRESGEKLLEAEEEKDRKEREIGSFYRALEEHKGENDRALEEKVLEVEENRKQLRQVEYEKLSADYHGLKGEIDVHAGNRDLIGMEKGQLEQEQEKLQTSIYVMGCAKLQEDVDREKKEWEESRQKVLVYRKRNEDLEPERNRLGAFLYRHYSELLIQHKGLLKENQVSLQEAQEKQQADQGEISQLNEELREKLLEMGRYQTLVRGFDQREDRFNDRYHTDFARNILGEYEPGSLEITKKEYEKQLQELQRKQTDRRRSALENEERQKALSRKEQDLSQEYQQVSWNKKELERKRDGLEKELQVRSVICRYFQIPEENLYETAKILGAIEHRLKENEQFRRKAEQEEDVLQKDYRRLTEGRKLELSSQFRSLLEELGIHYVYGMEWLRKNGSSEEQNRSYVKEHPFLPYSIILSQNDVRRLSACETQIFTEEPVPIICREMLEQKGDPEGKVIDLGRVSFYLYFDENLLNEEGLAALVKQKEEEIQKKRDQIRIRKEEYQDYFEKRECIRSQTISKDVFDQLMLELENLKEELERLDAAGKGIRQEQDQVRQLLEELQKEISDGENELQRMKRRLDDFLEFMQQYEQYLEDRIRLERLKKERERLQDRKELVDRRLERGREEIRTLMNRGDELRRQVRETGERLSDYQEYKGFAPGEDAGSQALRAKSGAGAGSQGAGTQDVGGKSDTSAEVQDAGKESQVAGTRDVSGKPGESAGAAEDSIGENTDGAGRRMDPDQAEARYMAITTSLSLELQELEAEERKKRQRLNRMEGELKKKAEKYRLTSNLWSEIIYDEKEELHLEEQLEKCSQEISVKSLQWNEEEKTIAALGSRLEILLEQIQDQCQQEKPLQQQDIRLKDYKAEKNQLQYEKKELLEQQKNLEDRGQGFEENLTALAEYAGFLGEEEQIGRWKQRIGELDRKNLRNEKGMLVRDHRKLQEDCRDARIRLERVIGGILRRDEFQDDYYRKPLEAMLELCEDGKLVLQQLSTTIAAYNTIIEKLKVDISFVEQERDHIVELLEEYIRDVHLDLGKIDANSTITIKERSLKMLKIVLPEWQENREMYHVRFRDFIDEVTHHGVELLEKNENVKDYFGTRLTTRYMYDFIVGIENIQIKLYKIEAQREYPITWAEVAKNSGGEGFLSAFVILSSLLYYMRRDDSDIFADKNEGKVLVMDNPFAQTNASHLLKPLMDMAKKTNTQLICLTGLGGDSIYGRFDNIYVLNLVTASLRGDVQYLKADHTKGSEPDTIVPSRIQVVEQMELVF